MLGSFISVLTHSQTLHQARYIFLQAVKNLQPEISAGSFTTETSCWVLSIGQVHNSGLQKDWPLSTVFDLIVTLPTGIV